MKLQNSDTDHFSRVLPRSSIVISGSLAAYALLLIWIYASVPDFNVFLLQAIAALIIAVASFIAGNTYRLRDVRKRQAYKLSRLARTDTTAREEGWDALVPPTTISFRFRFAIVGAILGTLAQVAIIVIFIQLDETITGIVATFLVAVLAGLVVLAGTYSRPID
ncbi:putative flippase GtrA [Microbacterium sp. SORGH_AS 1204]|uniref:hypothetical protein n=1 Tax=Microbacterium sp. SORGH_AS_1204 TaxID=3041785 RepID=UPI00278C9A7B|nr:hypothetical protein [Microbacterium sp. SORGH_AS_1204]MDQ1138450.1 putative flippase GtrA [Microbacterium sp. SORGH_AS_1204]